MYSLQSSVPGHVQDRDVRVPRKHSKNPRHVRTWCSGFNKLYCSDIEDCLKSGTIAFELLEAGHKYHIVELENAMLAIFEAMHSLWYSVDVAVKLLIFSRKVGQKMERIGERCLRLLKWYVESTEYLELAVVMCCSKY